MDRNGTRHDITKGTKDVWVVDYLQLQVRPDKYVQIIYDPDYLKPVKWRSLRTDPETLWEQLEIHPIRSSLIVDGGNIVRGDNIAFVTEKIFTENRHKTRSFVEAQLKKDLEINNILFIPTECGDFIGHSDGMIRTINNEHVLLNDYPDKGKYKQLNMDIRKILEDNRIHYTTFPYTSYRNTVGVNATGCYINYLELKIIFIFPSLTNRKIRRLFKS